MVRYSVRHPSLGFFSVFLMVRQGYGFGAAEHRGKCHFHDITSRCAGSCLRLRLTMVAWLSPPAGAALRSEDTRPLPWVPLHSRALASSLHPSAGQDATQTSGLPPASLHLPCTGPALTVQDSLPTAWTLGPLQSSAHGTSPRRTQVTSLLLNLHLWPPISIRGSPNSLSLFDILLG